MVTSRCTMLPFAIILVLSLSGASAFTPATALTSATPVGRAASTYARPKRSQSGIALEFSGRKRRGNCSALRNDLQDEIERAAQRRAYEERAQGGGTGNAIGGAVIGGLFGGPFGALFGAQVGASLGGASTLDKARKEEMRRRGITPEMLEQANEIGRVLSQAVDGLRATEESYETSMRLAKSLNQQNEQIYDKAKAAMQNGDEDGARRLLLERERIKEKLVKVLKTVTEEQKRLELQRSNVEALETRALEVESLLRRSVGASAMQGSVDLGMSLEAEDPLLRKFKDLGM